MKFFYFFKFLIFWILLFVIGLSIPNLEFKQTVFSSAELDSALTNAEDGQELSPWNNKFHNLSQASTTSTALFGVMQSSSSKSMKTLIQSALEEERVAIRNSMSNNGSQEMAMSKYTIDETGGTPIRNIILTTWRSGSTFLGEAVYSHPAVFYHYEPLRHFQMVQVRSEPLASEGLRVIKKLLKCDYTELHEYMKYGRIHSTQYPNTRVWQHCEKNRKLCNNRDFLSKMCKLFPFQIMKTVRLRLRYAESILQDGELNVRLVFLVRDPRGTMQSRRRIQWCYLNPECSDPINLCSDMVDDYQAAVFLKKKFPGKVLLVRYEDISMNPYNGVKRVLEFFGLTYHPMVKEFIRAHTSNNKGDAYYSTFRDSKTTPFLWIKYFAESGNTNKNLSYVQEKCSAAMKLWGYAHLDPGANNANFMPLLEPPWEDMAIPQDDVEE